jgi:hypothetical protein
MNVSNLLLNSIQELPSTFNENELAYLALTAKIENPIRDRIAYSMHRSKEINGLIVSREWKRRDLAILENSDADLNPLGVLEIKAMYSFDASEVASKRSQYIKLLYEDVSKAMKVATENTQIFFLLLVTHPHSYPPSSYSSVVKYWSQIRKSLTPPRTAQQTWRETSDYLSEHLPNDIESHHRLWNAGTAFGVKVEVGYWLLGPWKLA